LCSELTDNATNLIISITTDRWGPHGGKYQGDNQGKMYKVGFAKITTPRLNFRVILDLYALSVQVVVPRVLVL
jgi:hypothetical protein